MIWVGCTDNTASLNWVVVLASQIGKAGIPQGLWSLPVNIMFPRANMVSHDTPFIFLLWWLSLARTVIGWRLVCRYSQSLF